MSKEFSVVVVVGDRSTNERLITHVEDMYKQQDTVILARQGFDTHLKKNKHLSNNTLKKP